jgi:hypothetical protein
MEPGKPVRLEFMAFGGSFVDPELERSIVQCGPVTCDRMAGQLRPCARTSVRIGLQVRQGLCL